DQLPNLREPDVRLALVVLVDQLDLPPAHLTADLLHRDLDPRLVEGAQRRQRPGEREEHADFDRRPGLGGETAAEPGEAAAEPGEDGESQHERQASWSFHAGKDTPSSYDREAWRAEPCDRPSSRSAASVSASSPCSSFLSSTWLRPSSRPPTSACWTFSWAAPIAPSGG